MELETDPQALPLGPCTAPRAWIQMWCQSSRWVFGCRHRFFCHEAGLHPISLRFASPETEEAFVRLSGKKLPSNMVACSGMLVGTGLLTFMLSRVWEVDGSAQPERYQVLTNVFCAWAAIVGPVTVVMVMLRSSLTVAKLGPVGTEVLCVATLLLCMIGMPFIDSYYVARLWGVDPWAAWNPGERNFSDARLLLAIDIFITGSHMALPIRWCLLLPVEIVGALTYAAPAFVLGSYEGTTTSCYNLMSLMVLVVLSAYGKRVREIEERCMFAGFLAEKTLRFQTEFQLAQQASLQRKAEEEDKLADVEDSLKSRSSWTAWIFDETEPCLEDILDLGSREQWLIDETELEVDAKAVLGAGSFGIVLAGRFHGTSVAVKVQRQVPGPPNSNRSIKLCNELRILRRLRHPNIVYLYGACLDASANSVALILELVDGQALDRLIQESKVEESKLPNMDRLAILVDVGCALRYLHSRRPVIVHGDLKASNIMTERRPLNETSGRGRIGAFRPKLLDFGLSRRLTPTARPLGGTIRWVAPEVVRRAQHPAQANPSAAADVFSFGRVTFHVVTSCLPCQDIADEQLRQRMKTGPLPLMGWPVRAGRLVDLSRPVAEACCVEDATQRPCITTVHQDLDSIVLDDGANGGQSNDEGGSDAEVSLGSLVDFNAASPPAGVSASPEAICNDGQGGSGRHFLLSEEDGDSCICRNSTATPAVPKPSPQAAEDMNGALGDESIVQISFGSGNGADGNLSGDRRVATNSSDGTLLSRTSL